MILASILVNADDHSEPTHARRHKDGFLPWRYPLPWDLPVKNTETGVVL